MRSDTPSPVHGFHWNPPLPHTEPSTGDEPQTRNAARNAAAVFDTLGDIVDALENEGPNCSAPPAQDERTSPPSFSSDQFVKVAKFLANTLYDNSYGVSFSGEFSTHSNDSWGVPFKMGNQYTWVRTYPNNSAHKLVVDKTPPSFICVRSQNGTSETLGKCVVLALCSKRTLETVIEPTVDAVSASPGSAKKTLALMKMTNNSPVLPIDVMVEHRKLSPCHFHTLLDIERNMMQSRSPLVREYTSQGAGYRRILSGGLRVSNGITPMLYASMVDVRLQILSYLNFTVTGPLIGSSTCSAVIEEAELERTALRKINSLFQQHDQRVSTKRTNQTKQTKRTKRDDPDQPSDVEARLHQSESEFSARINAATAIADAATLSYAVRMLGNMDIASTLPDAMTSPGGLQLIIAIALRLTDISNTMERRRFMTGIAMIPNMTADQKRDVNKFRLAFQSKWKPLHHTESTPLVGGKAELWAIDALIIASVNTLNESSGGGEVEKSRADLQHAVLEWSSIGLHLIQEANGGCEASSATLRPSCTDGMAYDTLLRICNCVEHWLRTGTVAKHGWADVHFRLPHNEKEASSTATFVYSQLPVTWPFGSDSPDSPHTWVQVKHSICSMGFWLSVRNRSSSAFSVNTFGSQALTPHMNYDSENADELNTDNPLLPVGQFVAYDETCIVSESTKRVLRIMKADAVRSASDADSDPRSTSSIVDAVNETNTSLTTEQRNNWFLESASHKQITVTSPRTLGLYEGRISVNSFENAFRLATRTLLSGPEGLSNAIGLTLSVVGPQIFSTCCRETCQSRVLGVLAIFPWQHAQCTSCNAHLCLSCALDLGQSSSEDYICEVCHQMTSDCKEIVSSIDRASAGS